MPTAPPIRIRELNARPPRADGDLDLDDCQPANHLELQLDRAIDWCRMLGKPLLIYQALRSGSRAQANVRGT